MHLTIDNSYMMVTGQKQELDNLEILYTIRRKDAFFMQTRWNRGAKAPVVLLRGGLLPTGLLPEVLEKFHPTFDDKRVDPGKLTFPRGDNAPQLYDFQEETVNAALQVGRAIIDSPTNTGKTLMAGEIIRRIGRDTLYLISSPSALLQLRDKLQRILAVPVGVLGGGYKEDGVVVISTFSSAGKLNLRQYKCIVVDECHHAPAETYNEIITGCTDAYYRFGLTGTTEGRSDGLEKLMEAALSNVKL
jgi:superfamily II DNA or RNA helicase